MPKRTKTLKRNTNITTSLELDPIRHPTSERPPLVILGAAGLAHEFGAYCQDLGFEELLFVDDTETSPSHVKIRNESYPVVDNWKFPRQYKKFILGVGSPSIKKTLVKKAWESGLTPHPTLLHTTAYSATPDLGHGGMVCPGSIITVGVRLGLYTTVNLNCTIGHNTVIGEFSTLNPGVHISGEVTAGPCNVYGTGCTVRDRLNICGDSVFGAQCAVSTDIIQKGVYVGVPAKLLERNADDKRID